MVQFERGQAILRVASSGGENDRSLLFFSHEGKRRRVSVLHDPLRVMRCCSFCVLCASVVNPIR